MNKKPLQLPGETTVEVIRIENEIPRKKIMTYQSALKLKSTDTVKYIIYQLGFSQFNK